MCAAATSRVQKPVWSLVVDYTLFPLVALPVCCVYLVVARVLSMLVPFLILPTYLIARPFYWAVPLARAAFDSQHPFYVRWGFETTYAMNIIRRFLTLPLRRSVPDVYILGFPKCGTTALAQYLMQHPAISGIDGLPYDPALSKESHFFNGVLGPRTANSRLMYRSFFPTLVTRWWNEVVKGCGTWLCLDACPLSACLPYVAERIKGMSPDAKLIFMVRDPADSCFSGEIMIRNTGIDLGWSYSDDVFDAGGAADPADPRFNISAEDQSYFEMLEKLNPDEPLPLDMPGKIYTSPASYLYFSDFAARLAPYLERFPRENIMVLEMKEFYRDTERSVREVLEFVGADVDKYSFTEVAMWSGERRGRRMHPNVREKLDAYFEQKNERLFEIVGRRYPWGAAASSELPRAPDASSSDCGESAVVVEMDDLIATNGTVGVPVDVMAGGAVARRTTSGALRQRTLT